MSKAQMLEAAEILKQKCLYHNQKSLDLTYTDICDAAYHLGLAEAYAHAYRAITGKFI